MFGCKIEGVGVWKSRALAAQKLRGHNQTLNPKPSNPKALNPFSHLGWVRNARKSS